MAKARPIRPHEAPQTLSGLLTHPKIDAERLVAHSMPVFVLEAAARHGVISNETAKERELPSRTMFEQLSNPKKVYVMIPPEQGGIPPIQLGWNLKEDLMHLTVYAVHHEPGAQLPRHKDSFFKSPLNQSDVSELPPESLVAIAVPKRLAGESFDELVRRTVRDPRWPYATAMSGAGSRAYRQGHAEAARVKELVNRIRAGRVREPDEDGQHVLFRQSRSGYQYSSDAAEAELNQMLKGICTPQQIEQVISGALWNYSELYDRVKLREHISKLTGKKYDNVTLLDYARAVGKKHHLPVYVYENGREPGKGKRVWPPPRSRG